MEPAEPPAFAVEAETSEFAGALAWLGAGSRPTRVPGSTNTRCGRPSPSSRQTRVIGVLRRCIVPHGRAHPEGLPQFRFQALEAVLAGLTAGRARLDFRVVKERILLSSVEVIEFGKQAAKKRSSRSETPT